MCNAHNHPPGCSCGWGGSFYGKGPAPVMAFSQADSRSFRIPHFASLPSGYTNPNAKCPVCGETVYFYSSENGGRVFFDFLGPPWPKHPCTDNNDLTASFKKTKITVEKLSGKTKPLKASEKSWKKINNFIKSDDDSGLYRNQISVEIGKNTHIFYTNVRIKNHNPDLVFIKETKNGNYLFRLMYFSKVNPGDYKATELEAITNEKYKFKLKKFNYKNQTSVNLKIAQIFRSRPPRPGS